MNQEASDDSECILIIYLKSANIAYFYMSFKQAKWHIGEYLKWAMEKKSLFRFHKQDRLSLMGQIETIKKAPTDKKQEAFNCGFFYYSAVIGMNVLVKNSDPSETWKEK